MGMELPTQAGVMILNTVLFPQAVLPLHIFEPRYRRMLAECLSQHRMFVVSMQRPAQNGESHCEVAGLGVVRVAMTAEDGTSNVILQGVARVRLTRVVRYRPYRICELEPVAERDASEESVAITVLRDRALELAEQRIRQGFQLPWEGLKKVLGASGIKTTGEELVKGLRRVDDPSQLADLVAGLFLRGNPAALQLVLEAGSVEERFKRIVKLMVGGLA